MENKTIPVMATNIVYDMSSSSSSSSDSDSPVQQRERAPLVSVENQSPGYSNVTTNKPEKHRSVSPVRASPIAPRAYSSGALRPKRLVSSSAESKRTRRHTQQESNLPVAQKKWV